VAAPGNLGTEPQRVENTTFEVFGTIDGATAAGQSQFDRLTDTNGRITIALDRGADPASRASSLSVHLLIAPVAPPQTSNQLPTIFNVPIGVGVQPGEPVPSQLLPITITRTLTVESQSCGFPPNELPEGTYVFSCVDCSIVGTTLACTCTRIDGLPQDTQLDVGQCDPEKDIGNIDGVLRCERLCGYRSTAGRSLRAGERPVPRALPAPSRPPSKRPRRPAVSSAPSPARDTAAICPDLSRRTRHLLPAASPRAGASRPPRVESNPCEPGP
jgi:hypothetical protein